MAQTITLLNSILISYVSLTSLVCMSKSPIPNPTSTNNTTGFTMNLIHIDSPQSPHHDPSLSLTQTVVNAIRRSLDRIKSLNEGRSQFPETDIVRSIHSGDYLMKYAIGHKPVPSLGIMDTGSNLIWTQCYPCKHCLNQSPPLYKPSLSSTYRRINCNSFDCNSSTHTYCRRPLKGCFYSVTYGDGTSSWGRLSKDTLILASSGGTSGWFPGIVFGCGYNNNGTFYGQESGIVGLGRGKHSLVAQLGSSARGKFSYCLVSRVHKWSTSKLNFGENADVSGEGFVSTPLVHRDPGNFYYVNLVGLSVGDLSSFNKSLFSSIGEGNMFVDSGTTIATLPTDIYALLKSFVQREVTHFSQISDPMGLLDLCFETQGSDVKMPTVTFHFQDNADVKFDMRNMFVNTSWNSLCLGVLAEGGQSPGILGYFAQSNFMVGYDLEKERVYFKPTNCNMI